MSEGRFSETYFSIDHRFSLGDDGQTGDCYLAIPVSNGPVDYDEYYRLTAEQARSFLDDVASCISFVEACHRREHDDLLLYPPCERRGTPS
ncbi:MAG: hypothetical protein PGN37_11315 [Mycobacterium kyogaense]|uniref:hypothetical protein n=1 Tax=Mycobacterium kyogaense TaxID=2212479 RepID=UPI002FF6DF36